MKDFNEHVEHLLKTKSIDELREFIIKIAEKLPENMQHGFIAALKNKKVEITNANINLFKPTETLNRIKELRDNVHTYEIEAYYRRDYTRGRYSEEELDVESDDGFCSEFDDCYKGAMEIFEHRMYKEAVLAFDMLQDVIINFDNHNDSNDCGCITFYEIIGSSESDKIDVLKPYCSFMTNVWDESIFEEIYNTLGGNNCKPNFNDILEAGSEPVPDKEIILEKWILFLYTKTSQKASELLQEAANLAGKDNVELKHKFIESVEQKTPFDYKYLCELYISGGKAFKDKIIPTAIKGIKGAVTGSYEHIELANLLANQAKKTGDADVYRYAKMECFYARPVVENYLSIIEFDDIDLKNKALAYIENEHIKKNKHYYFIHFYEKNYDMVFEVIKDDQTLLGTVQGKYDFSPNLKVVMAPLFIGLLVRFNNKYQAISNCVCKSVKDFGMNAYRHLTDNVGTITQEQDTLWYHWCVNQVSNSADRLVAGKNRDCYENVAWLMFAIAELKKSRKEKDPYEMVKMYQKKYPRHPSFQSEVKTVLKDLKIEKM